MTSSPTGPSSPRPYSAGPETLASLVDAIIRWGRRLIPDQNRAERLADDLTSALTGSERDATPIDQRVLREVESICHRTARHLTLALRSPAEPDVDAVGWPPVPVHVVRRRAGFVRSVERFGNGHGLLRMDGFDDITTSFEYVTGAFSVLRGVDGLILDLRHNGGGAPSTLALVAEFVLGTGMEHLSTVRYRHRPERQWWTSVQLGGTHLPVDRPVAVLVGSGTYSSGEALAYHLQTRGRVRVFGQRTPGAADHVTPIRVTPSVVALVPEGTPMDMVSGSNWEGGGVLPDVRTAPDDSEAVAMTWLEKVTSLN